MNWKVIFVLAALTVSAGPFAQPLTIEITEGAEGATPIAIVPFGWQGPDALPGDPMGSIIAGDLARSGLFKPMPVADMLALPHDGDGVDFRDWRAQGMDNLVVGRVEATGPGSYEVKFRLFDVYRQEQLAGYRFPVTGRNWRTTAHRIADIIYEQLTGQKGAFSTRIAYVTSTRLSDGKEEVALQVADADGYGPQTIYRSRQPLMSPAWSPDGTRIAYVSFEGERRSAIIVQEILSGKREKVISERGINGAPAWSPDGRRLALTLSRDGSPDIYVLDLNSRALDRLTTHYAIDTEPAWAPDGRSLFFTSDRGGKPQIYRVSVSGGAVTRVTFDGDYNARPTVSPDGKLLAMVTRFNGDYRIGVLELDRGLFQVLSEGALDESPSFAPNGRMIIYAANAGYRGVLAAVSVDGRVHQEFGFQAGNVREPAWSPQID